MPAKTKIAKQILDEINDYLSEKATLDGIVNLSKGNKKELSQEIPVNEDYKAQGYMTLFSEGSFLYSDGTIRMYVTKGAIKEWYDSISDDFQGYVSTGHRDLNSYPVREGYFEKKDLKIVYDEQGRADLLVKPVVNLELSNIKDLLLQDEPFAISAEVITYQKQLGEDDIEEYAKLIAYNQSKGGSEDIYISDKIELLGFSFVGNPGNAKSGGYEPSLLVRNEEERLEKENLLDRLLAQLSKEEATETPVEEKAEEVAKEEVAQEDEVVVEEAIDKEQELVELATKRIEELEAENASLKEENAKLAEFKKAKEAEEADTNVKLAKLEKLLTKAGATVEAPTEVEKKEDKVKNIFGRERFGGL